MMAHRSSSRLRKVPLQFLALARLPSAVGCVSGGEEIVRRCLEAGLAEGRNLAVDGTLVVAESEEPPQGTLSTV